MTEKTLLGRLPREAMRVPDPPSLERDLAAGVTALADLTGTISDGMDLLGIVGLVPACGVQVPPADLTTRTYK